MANQPKRLTDEEKEDLADKCEERLAEIIIDNQDIADKALPKLLDGLNKFAEACERSRLNLK